MKWHKCTNELPKDTHSGSYLILNHFGDIAEAEYREATIGINTDGQHIFMEIMF